MSTVESSAVPPTVSALIVTYTQHLLLPRCLGALRRAARDIPLEVVVVVNGVPLTPEHRAAEEGGAAVVRAPINLGLAGGLLLARAHASGRYLALVQDDVEVGDDWLEPLVAALESEPTVGAVASRVLLTDGTLQHEGFLIRREGRNVLLGDPDCPGPRRAVDGFGSSASLVRASAWDAVGGPDPELFPNGHVDVDLSLRLGEAGWTILVEPRSIAVHVRSASTSARVRKTAWRRNWARVRRRHAAALAELAVDGSDAEAVAAALRRRAADAAARRTPPSPRSAPPATPSVGALVWRVRLTRLRLCAFIVTRRARGFGRRVRRGISRAGLAGRRAVSSRAPGR